MIIKPTCLVLGAGASVPYGLPTGPQLRDLVLTRVARPNDKICTAISQAGYPRDHLTAFVAAFESSGQSSVDAFLGHRADFVRVGKAAIAAVLILHENPQHLISPKDPHDHWYQYLWTALQAGGKDQFSSNRLSVVSFNYDRSFQRFLIDAYRHSFGASEDEAWAAIVSTIPFIQVHGSLGTLSPDPGTNGSRQYRPLLEPWAIHVAAQAIAILSEHETTSPEFENAQTCIARAETVLLIGCAFHDANMLRIGLGPDTNGRIRLGSAYGLTVRERSRAKALWGVETGSGEWKSLAFLRELVDLI